MRFIYLITFTLLCNIGFAQNRPQDNPLYIKGNEHFANTKWNEAAVLYEMLLNDYPKDANLYAKGIVSKSLYSNSADFMALVIRSEKCGVALDSLFANTYDICKSIKRFDKYEDILLTIKDNQPWFSRVINNYLLDLYVIQKNNIKGITLANSILEYSKNNSKVKKQLIYMLSDIGLNERAAEVAKSVIAWDNDLEAKRFLASYLLYKGRECSQLGYSSIEISRDSAIAKYYMPARMIYENDSALSRNPVVQGIIKEINLVIDSTNIERYSTPKSDFKLKRKRD